jgi:hypothetical protein
LYVETKRGLVDPVVAGKLTHQLGLMINSTRGVEFDLRLEALEQAMAERQDQRYRPNGGGARHAARP